MLAHWLRRKKPAPARRVVPHAEWLEPRLLFSADLGAGWIGSTSMPLPHEERSLSAQGEYARSAQPQSLAEAYVTTALNFEKNVGQARQDVDFIANGSGYTIALADGDATIMLAGAKSAVHLEIVGGRDDVKARAEGQLEARSNYLLGNDKSKWLTDIANYRAVLYEDVYRGVDVRYYGTQRKLEYDFIVAAGADASQIRLRFEGADARLDAKGNLLLRTPEGRDISFDAPVSYQQGANGREAVASAYRLHADGSVSIKLGAYDKSRELVIDPVLSYATYFGESGTETGVDVAVDAAGKVYVTGTTNSTSGILGSVLGGLFGTNTVDTYVAKFNADLSVLEWTSRVGGNGEDRPLAIAVDAAGSAVVAGWTESSNLATPGAADTSLDDDRDAFVYRLNAAGTSVLFATYYGSGDDDKEVANAVALDPSGNIYIAGGAKGVTGGSSPDAFVARYGSNGALQLQFRYGSNNDDVANGIAVDAAGHMYIVGDTKGGTLQMLNGHKTVRGSDGEEGFLVRFDATGTLVWGSYIGGNDKDTAVAVAVDGDGRAYVVGQTKDTRDSGFALTTGWNSNRVDGKNLGYLRIYDTDLSGSASLLYSTLVGGTRADDAPIDVALRGDVVIVLSDAKSTDFETTGDALDRTHQPGNLHIAAINPGNAGAGDLVWGSFYGNGVTGGGLALNGMSIYLVGSTGANGLATPGAADTTRSGQDAIIGRVVLQNSAPVLTGFNPQTMLEDQPGNGFLVSALIANKLTDTNAGAVLGIAITGAASVGGSWEYSLNGGTVWTTVGAPVPGTALLLAADSLTRLRFTPALHYNGNGASLSFRGWDRTAGSAGGTANASVGGGTSAFSLAEVTAPLTVTPVNDVPQLTAGTVADLAVVEGQAATSLGFAGLAYDGGGNGTETAQALTFTITDVPPAAFGRVELANGTLVVLNQSYTLLQLQGMRFAAGAPSVDSETFAFRVTDNGTPAATLTQSLQIRVSNVAPVLSGSNPLPVLAEDPTSNNGMLVADLVAGRIVDPSGSYGIAVVAAAHPGGTWEYSRNNGSSWSGFTGVSAEDAYLLAADGQARVRFVPAANWNGTAGGLDFHAWDRSGVTAGATRGDASLTGADTPFSTASASASITVTAVNDRPVATPVSASGNEDAVSIPVTLGGTDVEGAIQSITLALPPIAQGKLYTDATLLVEAVAGSYAGSSLALWYVPAPNFNGSAGFSYTVTDNEGLASTPAAVTIAVAPVNDAPVALDSSATGAEDASSISLLLLHSDVDGVVSTVRFHSLPTALQGKLYIDAARSILAQLNTDYGVGTSRVYFVPAADFNGGVTFSFSVADNNGAVDATPATATITVTPVNDRPVATGAAVSGTEDVPIAITLGGTDIDGTIQGVTLATLPTLAQGRLFLDAGLTVAATTGSYAGSTLTLYFAPTLNFNGSASFSYSVIDDQGLAAAANATATITLAAVNDAPQASDVTATGAEDAASIAITLTGSDPESAITKITLATLPNPAEGLLYTNAARTLLASVGTFNGASVTLYFVPAANFNGTASFTFTVTDATNLVDATPATATIIVTPVNDAPVAAGATATGDEDGGPIAITLGGSDIDGTIASVTLATLPPLAQGRLFTDIGLTTLAVPGTYAGSTLTLYFAPAQDFNGAATFSYSVTDNLGLASAGATATVNVAAVNDLPEAADVGVSGDEDAAAIVLTLHGTDVEGAIAKITLLSLPPVTEGLLYTDANLTTLALAGSAYDGASLQLYFAPARDFNGTVSFGYTVTDSAGASDASAATASITVRPVNDAPIASGASATGNEDGGPIAITLGGSDIDGTIASVTLATLPPLAQGRLFTDAGLTTLAVPGTYAGSTLTLYFAPAQDFNGAATFSYSVTDNLGTASAAGLATLAVTPVNDAPVATGASASGAEDATSIAITLGGSDVDGTGIAGVTLIGLPANGTLYLDANRTIAAAIGTTYTGSTLTLYFVPVRDFNGSTSFGYAVLDPEGVASAPATATLVVTAVNDAPVGTPVTASGAEDAATSIAITLGGSDVDGAVQSVTLVNLPANGLLYLDSAGTLLAAAGVAYAGSSLTLYFVPAQDFAGSTGFDFHLTDDQGLAGAAARATLAVTPVNDAPVLIGTLPNLAVPDGVEPAPLGLADISYSVGGGADEAATQTLSVTITALPSSLGQVLLADGTVVTLNTSYTLDQLHGMQFRAAAAVGSGPATFGFTVTDNGGIAGGGANSLAQSLSVTVVNRAPVLTGANPLPGRLEDAADDDGMLVADLIAGKISDPQNTFGIAVVAASSPGGRWEYSRDNGASWLEFTDVSDAEAVLLEADAFNRIRFVSNPDWSGTATGLVFRGWDQSGDTAGTTTGDTRIHGNASAYSDMTAQASIMISPVNDAPVLAGANPLPAMLEDAATNAGISIEDLLAGQVTDADPGALYGIAVTAAQSNDGSWEFSLDDGANWSAIGTVSDSEARLLAADGQTRIRFVPATDWNGDAGGLWFRAWDRTGSTDGLTHGGTTASGASGPYSVAVAEALVTVIAVNDAPEGNAVTVTGQEDADSITITLGGSDVEDAVAKIKLSTLPAAGEGRLYIDAAHTTLAMAGTAYDGTTLTLYFVPAADFHGTVSFSYTVIDGDGLADATPATATIVVTPVNDAPVATGATASGDEDRGPIAITLGGSDIDGTIASVTLDALPPALQGKLYTDAGLTVEAVLGATYAGTSLTLYFVPAGNFNGSASISYTVTDDAGQVSAAAAATIVVTPVNDAPVQTSGTVADVVALEGGTVSLGLSGLAFSTGGGGFEAAQTLTYTVTTVPASAFGTVLLADGSVVVAGNNYTLAQLQGMRFAAGAGVTGGSGSFAFSVRDNGGTATGGSDLLQRSLAISVRNQAPVLSGVNLLPALLEDAGANAGMLVADLVGGRISDPSNAFGIAVVGATSPGGSWEFSRDGGSSWSSLAGTSETRALLLSADSQTRIRFVPAPNWNGTASGLSLRAWDHSDGLAAGSSVELRALGGSSAFSSATATASVVVTPVNDAPVPVSTAPRVIAGDGQGGPIAIDFDQYLAGNSDDEKSSQSLSLVITSLPPATQGTLYLADGVTPVRQGAAYSEGELRGMKFVPAASGIGGDINIGYAVRDDGGTAGGGVDQTPGTLLLRLPPSPVAAVPVAPPPEMGNGPAPAPAPVTVTTPAAPPAAAAPAATPGRAPAPQAATGDALVDSPAPSTLLPAASDMSFAAERRSLPLESVRPTIGLAERGAVQLVGFNPTAADFQVMGFNALSSGGTRLTIEEFQQTLRSEEFLQQLNKLRDGLRQEFDLDQTVSISVAGVSLGLSVAYVLWLVRGGVLVGSYLSALPAWRLLDPLPVLAHAGEEEEDEEDEPLDARGDALPSDPLRGFA